MILATINASEVLSHEGMGQYSENSMKYELSVEAVIIKGTEWESLTQSQWTERYTRVAEIYRQCDIKVTAPIFKKIDAPNFKKINGDYYSTASDSGWSLSHFLSKTALTNIRIFYLEEIEGGHLAYASAPSFIPLATNDIYFSEEDFYYSNEPNYYQTEAHELAHILLNSPHVESETPHIMATPYSSSYISPEQCALMHQSEFVKKVNRK